MVDKVGRKSDYISDLLAGQSLVHIPVRQKYLSKHALTLVSTRKNNVNKTSAKSLKVSFVFCGSCVFCLFCLLCLYTVNCHETRVSNETRNLFREISVSFGKFREILVKFLSLSESSVLRNFGKFREISDNFGKISQKDHKG